MVVPTSKAQTDALHDVATRLRIDSVRSTSEAGSGHVTSCASAAEIMAALFFSVMRYDPKDPQNPDNDRFVLSKGHAAPILYAAWAEAGLFPPEELLDLRTFESDLEGHPTPRLSFIDAGTGALGQGLAVGAGLALGARLDGGDQRIYVLMGDGETSEGSVWESAAFAADNRLANLCGIVDVNGYGQSEPAMLGHDLERHQARWEAFGWRALPVDGHNVEELLDAFERAAQSSDQPTVILASTVKGKDIPGVEDENVHGKPLEKGEQTDKAVRHLESLLRGADKERAVPQPPSGAGRRKPAGAGARPDPSYRRGEEVATRQAFGDALAAFAKTDPRLVTLDGDVKNSTKTQEFEDVAPERFFQSYIAEQNMVGAGMGLAASGKIPFATSFACFLTRAFDFIRMAAISRSNLKFAGSHAGVSIGADGPSQMGLEDLAMFCAEPGTIVLYPSDANAAWRATGLAIETDGIVYLRTNRPKTPVLYDASETFEVGRAKVLRSSDDDRVTIVAAGVTLLEALEAHDRLAEDGFPVRVIDLFSVKPIDRETLVEAARATGGRVLTVEDHYLHGGLGDAVFAALLDEPVRGRKLAVNDVPRSGKPEKLLNHFGLSANHIAQAARDLAA